MGEPLTEESQAVVDGLGNYTLHYTHLDQHKLATQHVEARLQALEARVRAAENKCEALGNSARAVFMGDVCIKASDGSSYPALKETLVAASAFFKARLTGTGAEMNDGEAVLTIDAKPEALRALIFELHMPGFGPSVEQSVAFEVLQLIELLGGPADTADTEASANDAMSKAIARFTTDSAPT